MDFSKFSQKFGAVKEINFLNDLLDNYNMYDPKNPNAKNVQVRLLKGKFYNIGYFRKGVKYEEVIKDLDNHIKNLTYASEYSTMLRSLRLSSNISSKFFPFVLNLDKDMGNFVDNFKHAIGFNVSNDFIDVVGDIIIENKKNSRSAFWKEDMDSEMEEYLSEDDTTKYCEVTEKMKDELRDLKYIYFPAEYNYYPVFSVGTGFDNTLVGVTAFRVDK